MKNLIGHEVTFVVGELPNGNFSFKGIIQGEEKGLVLVKDKSGKIVRVNKSKIIMFIPETEPDESGDLSTSVYGCYNLEKNCKGVRYMKVGDRKETDFEEFMMLCPHRCDSCLKRYLGDHRQLSRRVLANDFDGLVIGEYPKEKLS